MDPRLVAWARQVKARKRLRPGAGGVPSHRRLPTLWLFTDRGRLPDPLPAIARLPVGLCGVVFRHDAAPAWAAPAWDAAARAALAHQVARLCRARRTALVVAGDPWLARAAGAGVHLRNGWRGRLAPPARCIVTSSAHDQISLVRARRSGAEVVFLSPLFPTASHPEVPALGPLRWCSTARGGMAPGRCPEVYALGGVNGDTARRVPRRAGGAGAISAAMG